MGIDAKTGYYTMRDILGYNCKFNFVYSDRGRGKTFGAKHFLMEQEGRFMCLYLDSEDMNKAKDSWTDALVESGKYGIEQFDWEGDEGGWQLMCNGMIKGYFRYLTAVRHIKHEKFPEVNRDEVINWVFMDEFITPDTKKLRGIKSMGDAIRMVLKTIDHDSSHPRETRGLKPLRMLLFANPFTWDNEINAYFHIVPMGFGIHKAGPDIVYEILPPLEKKDGKMTVDEFLGDEVNKNIGYVEQTAFVCKMPKGVVPYCSIRFDNEYFHIYKAPRNAAGYYYIKQSTKHKECFSYMSGRNVFGTLEGLKEDEYCIEKTGLIKALTRRMYEGDLRYVDINVKFRFMNALINAKK